MTRPILLTGAAGFIGYHYAERLLAEGHEVVGFDSVNAYYDVALKEARLARLAARPGFRLIRADLADRAAVERAFAELRPELVVHLAAQAGVRYSLKDPHAYLSSNLAGTLNVLEGCRHHGAEHLVFASSSSVYGANTKLPFSVSDNVDHPVSLYAATKKSNELMAHCYSHLYGIPTTGLRFFTVYGPWGRPDMAYYSFTRKILAGEPIEVFNHGRMQRDFTYIDDIVEGVYRTMLRVPEPETGGSGARYRLYNIGNHSPVELLRFIELLEGLLGRKAERKLLPMQPGDVVATYADVADLTRDTGFEPATPIEEGLARFVRWYRDHHGVG